MEQEIRKDPRDPLKIVWGNAEYKAKMEKSETEGKKSYEALHSTRTLIDITH